MHWTELNMREKIFTHISDDWGEIVFAVNRLKKAVIGELNAERLSWVCIAIEPSLAKYIFKFNGIEGHRLTRISEFNLDEPLLFCDKEGKQILVDGNHRYVRRYQLGKREALAVIVPEALWKDFVVTGLPEGTPEELMKRFSGIH